MARPLHRTAHVSLRIRESLRRRLEQDAKRHHTSLNNMIRLKLEDSYAEQDRKDHAEHNADMEVLLARYAGHLTLYELQQDLIQAMEKSTDPQIAKLARVWLHTRAVDRRLTEGGMS
jgi:hypothetical protein